MAYPNMWREVAAEYNVSPKYSVLIACIDIGYIYLTQKHIFIVPS